MIIAGNWKMNVGPDVAGELALTLSASESVTSWTNQGGQVIVFPPYVSLQVVVQRLRSSPIRVGAQNCHWEQSGAYTGEVSADMIHSIGCSHVLVGHSEQRRDQGDTDVRVGLRARAAVAAGLTPIICLGETLEEYRAELTLDVIDSQVDTIIAAAGLDTLRSSLWAYEPRWAIGTGLTPSMDQIADLHGSLRHRCRSRYGFDIPILYGGSVTEDNASDVLQLPDVDGALIGGVSLQPARFQQLMTAANNVCVSKTGRRLPSV